jgi:hypothetical protein
METFKLAKQLLVVSARISLYRVECISTLIALADFSCKSATVYQ